MREYGKSYLPVLLIVGSFTIAAQASAQEIFKWVDENGDTHYSEEPPGVDVAGLEILEVVSKPAEPAPASDFRTTLEVANAMQADRLERERLRLEKLKLDQLNRQTRLDAMRYDEVYGSAYYYGPYYPYRYRPHGKHRGYPRPPTGQQPPPVPYHGNSIPKRVFSR